MAAQEVGVVAEPEVQHFHLHDEAEHLVICSDGVWQFMSDYEVVQLAHQYGNKCKLAAEKIFEVAKQRWLQHEAKVVDDITVVVVYLPWQLQTA